MNRQKAKDWRVNQHNGMRSATPPAFRDVLLQRARSAHPAFAASGGGVIP